MFMIWYGSIFNSFNIIQKSSCVKQIKLNPIIVIYVRYEILAISGPTCPCRIILAYKVEEKIEEFRM